MPESSRRAPSSLWPAAILTAYCMLLLALLGLTPLWLDELQQFGSARHNSWAQLMNIALIVPGAAPLPYLFQNLVVDWLGFSTWTARLPAALSSLCAGVIFWSVAQDEKPRARILALVLFLALPLQFRYALEARGYSMGLACSLLSFRFFQALSRQPSIRRSLLYCASVMVGLYAHPFTCFPIVAQVLWVCWPARATRLRMAAVASAAVGAASFLPWYFLQGRAVARVKPTWDYFFSISQVRPAALLHDLTGGGYVCTIAILGLCAIGVWLGRGNRSLFVCMAAVSLIGPILADAYTSYFFANRQLLFAMPAIILLAARGADALLETRARAPLWAALLLGSFVAASIVADFRNATVPRDDLVASAGELAARVHEGDCFLTAPPNMAAQFVLLRPELQNKVCADTPAEAAYAVTNQYTRPQDRESLARRLGARYRLAQTEHIGRTDFDRYESTGQ